MREVTNLNRDEAPHPNSDAQHIHALRAAAAGTLAAALLARRAAKTTADVAKAYEDAYNIMFPAKNAPAYQAWARENNITVR